MNQKLEKLLCELDIPIAEQDSLRGFHDYLESLYLGRAKQVAVYCMGEFGYKMLCGLKMRLVDVTICSDFNPKKWGTVVEGVPCVSPEALAKSKKNTLVVVANSYPLPVMEELANKGFALLVSYHDVWEEMKKTNPVCWIDGLDRMDTIDYSSELVCNLICNFNKFVFQICKEPASVEQIIMDHELFKKQILSGATFNFDPANINIQRLLPHLQKQARSLLAERFYSKGLANNGTV